MIETLVERMLVEADIFKPYSDDELKSRNPEATEKFEGYLMTKKELRQLRKELTDDILARYDGPEYWEPDIVEEFVTAHGCQKVRYFDD